VWTSRSTRKLHRAGNLIVHAKFRAQPFSLICLSKETLPQVRCANQKDKESE